MSTRFYQRVQGILQTAQCHAQVRITAWIALSARYLEYLKYIAVWSKISTKAQWKTPREVVTRVLLLFNYVSPAAGHSIKKWKKIGSARK